MLQIYWYRKKLRLCVKPGSQTIVFYSAKFGQISIWMDTGQNQTVPNQPLNTTTSQISHCPILTSIADYLKDIGRIQSPKDSEVQKCENLIKVMLENTRIQEDINTAYDEYAHIYPDEMYIYLMELSNTPKSMKVGRNYTYPFWTDIRDHIIHKQKTLDNELKKICMTLKEPTSITVILAKYR